MIISVAYDDVRSPGLWLPYGANMTPERACNTVESRLFDHTPGVF